MENVGNLPNVTSPVLLLVQESRLLPRREDWGCNTPIIKDHLFPSPELLNSHEALGCFPNYFQFLKFLVNTASSAPPTRTNRAGLERWHTAGARLFPQLPGAILAQATRCPCRCPESESESKSESESESKSESESGGQHGQELCPGHHAWLTLLHSGRAFGCEALAMPQAARAKPEDFVYGHRQSPLGPLACPRTWFSFVGFVISVLNIPATYQVFLGHVMAGRYCVSWAVEGEQARLLEGP